MLLPAEKTSHLSYVHRGGKVIFLLKVAAAELTTCGWHTKACSRSPLEEMVSLVRMMKENTDSSAGSRHTYEIWFRGTLMVSNCRHSMPEREREGVKRCVGVQPQKGLGI